MFFTLPLGGFLFHIVAIEHGWESAERWHEFSGLKGVYESVSALVFGLAGLRSFDRYVDVKHNGKSEKEKP